MASTARSEGSLDILHTSDALYIGLPNFKLGIAAATVKNPFFMLYRLFFAAKILKKMRKYKLFKLKIINVAF